MKYKIAFLSLTMLFAVLLSGVVSAAAPDNNTTLPAQQVVQNQSQKNVSAQPSSVNTRTHYNSTDIQPVIDDANTLKGDTISIKGGFTYGHVILNKSLTLVWDGTGTKPIILYLYINSGGKGSIIDGLDIKYNSSINPQAGITLDNTSNVVIKNSVISGFKIGLYQLNSTDITIWGNKITKSSFSGIGLFNSTAVIKNGNNITGNTGYGIYCEDSTVNIESNAIGSDEHSRNEYSGIYIGYTSPSNTVNTIKGNIISYNSFTSYSNLNSNGIILLNARGNNIIQNNTINNNNGDGIFMGNSVAAITGNRIYNSKLYGIRLFDSSTATITGNQICNGYIGIYSKNSAVDIKNNTIGNNQDYQIFLDNTSSTGVISNNIYGNHGMYFNAYNQLAQFNRIVTKYCSIENFGATLNANFNWWGSNTGPIPVKIEGTNTNIDSWLVLTMLAQPSTIWTSGTSTVIADIKHDNKGNIHNEGYLPDGIPVNFSNVTLGTINSLLGTVNGLVTATFTAGTITGLANVNATFDNQNVSTNVSIIVPPTVSVTPDQGNFYAPVKVSLNASGEYSPYKIFFTTDGSTPTINSVQYSEPINFNTTHTLKYFVQDNLGNKSQIYTKKYNIYKLVTYKYAVKVPVKKWYKSYYWCKGKLKYKWKFRYVTVKVKKWYKSRGKWKFKYVTAKVKKWYKSYYWYKGKLKYKWKYKWVKVIKYTTVYKTGKKWRLT